MNYLSELKPWITAARLRTLPLAASNIILGSLLAVYYKSFNLTIFILGLTTALLLQILSNFANDYGDFKSGADAKRQSTYERALQSGKITPAKMKRVIIGLSVITLFTGISLIFSGNNPLDQKTVLIFLGTGLLCICAAITYTMGKKPYGYSGLGDIAVFLFFGLTGVCGIFFLYTHSFNWAVFLPAASLGLLSTGVLNVNNIRDINSDKVSGKNTLVVRMGLKKAKIYHTLLISFAISLSLLTTLFIYEHVYQFLYLITIPFFVRNVYIVSTASPDSPPALLDKELRNLAVSTFLFSVTYGISLLL